MRRLVMVFLVVVFACGATVTLSLVPDLVATLSFNPAEYAVEGQAAIEEFSQLGTAGDVIVVIVTLPLVLLAGISEALGQFYILLANRVRPARFMLTLGLNIIIFLFGYFVTVLGVYLAGWIVHGRGTLLLVSLVTVAVSYQPLLLGFLSVLPYFGSYIMRVLYLLASILLAQSLIGVGFTPAQAFATALLSLIIVYVLRATIGRPLVWLARKARNITAGTRLGRSIDEALTYRGGFLVRPEE